MNTSIFTCGDVNGIGPEIVLKTLNDIYPISKNSLIFVCPKNIFLETSKLISPKFPYSFVKKVPRSQQSSVLILNIGNTKQKIGEVTRDSGIASYKSIVEACKLAEANINSSIITAPISKLAFSKAGIEFPGHTELFANYFNASKFVMMFVSKKMKAGLVTIHIPLKDVPKSIKKQRVIDTIEVIYNSMKKDFGINKPKIALLGLNPHAGEKGKIGFEEEKILIPLLKRINFNVSGPFVPDAYFGNKIYKKYDCTIGLYHDQVLIPFKLLNFNRGVNFTAGLPIIRTSPDHGTAYDIAGKGIANPASMIEAYQFSEIIRNNRSKIQ
ncbi:MAG: 4-hydroxythreonine-4-phosphate dehydrogenase PdxA [Melioribacteraceae bacterium]|nr:4-hydroxythreonine-4-phosphate dehydrogenase PdxA [Melioribacteraceae bacterium]